MAEEPLKLVFRKGGTFEPKPDRVYAYRRVGLAKDRHLKFGDSTPFSNDCEYAEFPPTVEASPPLEPVEIEGYSKPEVCKNPHRVRAVRFEGDGNYQIVHGRTRDDAVRRWNLLAEDWGKNQC